MCGAGADREREQRWSNRELDRRPSHTTFEFPTENLAIRQSTYLREDESDWRNFDVSCPSGTYTFDTSAKQDDICVRAPPRSVVSGDVL